MASALYLKAIENVVRGNIDFDTHAFKVMLVTGSYAPNFDTHEDRADVTNEVANGNGYATGGANTTATVSSDGDTDRVEISFSNVAWADATITARAAIIYKSTGVAANDLLVAYVDFTEDVSSTNAAFAVTFSSALRFQL